MVAVVTGVYLHCTVETSELRIGQWREILAKLSQLVTG